MPLEPIEVEKLLYLDDKNRAKKIAVKLGEGKPLTAADRAYLSQKTPARENNFAASWDDLADALGIEERSLFNFRQRHAPRVKADGRQLTRADGRHDIAAWRALGDEFGELRGKGINNPATTPEGYIDERSLRLRERQHDLERSEHKLAAQKRAVLPLVEYQSALRLTVGAFDGSLKQLAGRAADEIALRAREAIVTLLRAQLTPKQFEKLNFDALAIDASAVIIILEAEIEVLRATLAAADFLENDEPPSDTPAPVCPS